MELICFPRMGTKSKRLMLRRKAKGGRQAGKTYHYNPRRQLVFNLAHELKMSEAAVRKQIFKERLHLLQEIYGSDVITAKDI